MNRKELEEFISDAYGISGEYPFEGDNVTCVFRHSSNKKWFAIVMEIPKTRLGLKEEGTATILNTKCDYILINSFLKEKGFFPAYHMNKSHWISTSLDGSVDGERIKSLIDMSFELTDIKRRKRNKKEKPDDTF